jgi:hypothetical protein
VTRRGLRWDRIGPIALLVLVVLVLAACAAPVGPNGSPIPSHPAPPLEPAQPGADPLSFLAWLFTPIFKAMFIVLVGVYDLLRGIGVPAAIGWAIVALTLSGPSSSRSTDASSYRSGGCSSCSPRSRRSSAVTRATP